MSNSNTKWNNVQTVDLSEVPMYVAEIGLNLLEQL